MNLVFAVVATWLAAVASAADVRFEGPLSDYELWPVGDDGLSVLRHSRRRAELRVYGPELTERYRAVLSVDDLPPLPPRSNGQRSMARLAPGFGDVPAARLRTLTRTDDAVHVLTVDHSRVVHHRMDLATGEVSVEELVRGAAGDRFWLIAGVWDHVVVGQQREDGMLRVRLLQPDLRQTADVQLDVFQTPDTEALRRTTVGPDGALWVVDPVSWSEVDVRRVGPDGWATWTRLDLHGKTLRSVRLGVDSSGARVALIAGKGKGSELAVARFDLRGKALGRSEHLVDDLTELRPEGWALIALSSTTDRGTILLAAHVLGSWSIESLALIGLDTIGDPRYHLVLPLKQTRWARLRGWRTDPWIRLVVEDEWNRALFLQDIDPITGDAPPMERLPPKVRKPAAWQAIGRDETVWLLTGRRRPTLTELTWPLPTPR